MAITVHVKRESESSEVRVYKILDKCKVKGLLLPLIDDFHHRSHLIAFICKNY